MPEAKILISRNGNIGVIKIVGVGNFQGAVVFKSTYTQLLTEGVTEFVMKLRQMGSGVVHVIHANEMIKSLFRGTGLDQIFDMTEPKSDPS
jgi:anti-anti-sigma regulatory factor